MTEVKHDLINNINEHERNNYFQAQLDKYEGNSLFLFTFYIFSGNS